MRTRTILEALMRAVEMEQEYGHDWAPYHSAERHQRLSERQIGRFRAEILRRMDERDAWHTMFPVSTPAQVAIRCATVAVGSPVDISRSLPMVVTVVKPRAEGRKRRRR